MNPPANSARKRIGNKDSVIKWVEHPVDCMVEEPVGNSSLVNISRFRIANIKFLIVAVFIGIIQKVGLKLKNIVHQINRKKLNIFFAFLAFHEFKPSV